MYIYIHIELILHTWLLTAVCTPAKKTTYPNSKEIDKFRCMKLCTFENNSFLLGIQCMHGSTLKNCMLYLYIAKLLCYSHTSMQ